MTFRLVGVPVYFCILALLKNNFLMWRSPAYFWYWTLIFNNKITLFPHLDYSKDASYLGKILEGFTLASKHNEEKTVSSLTLIPLSSCIIHIFNPASSFSLPPSHFPPVISPPCRSFLLLTCPGTTVPYTTSVLLWTCPVWVPLWPRPCRPPGVTWSRKGTSGRDATSWTLLRGESCWGRWPYKVQSDQGPLRPKRHGFNLAKRWFRKEKKVKINLWASLTPLLWIDIRYTFWKSEV